MKTIPLINEIMSSVSRRNRRNQNTVNALLRRDNYNGLIWCDRLKLAKFALVNLGLKLDDLPETKGLVEDTLQCNSRIRNSGRIITEAIRVLTKGITTHACNYAGYTIYHDYRMGVLAFPVSEPVKDVLYLLLNINMGIIGESGIHVISHPNTRSSTAYVPMIAKDDRRFTAYKIQAAKNLAVLSTLEYDVWNIIRELYIEIYKDKNMSTILNNIVLEVHDDESSNWHPNLTQMYMCIPYYNVDNPVTDATIPMYLSSLPNFINKLTQVTVDIMKMLNKPLSMVLMDKLPDIMMEESDMQSILSALSNVINNSVIITKNGDAVTVKINPDIQSWIIGPVPENYNGPQITALQVIKDGKLEDVICKKDVDVEALLHAAASDGNLIQTLSNSIEESVENNVTNAANNPNSIIGSVLEQLNADRESAEQAAQTNSENTTQREYQEGDLRDTDTGTQRYHVINGVGIWIPVTQNQPTNNQGAPADGNLPNEGTITYTEINNNGVRTLHNLFGNGPDTTGEPVDANANPEINVGGLRFTPDTDVEVRTADQEPETVVVGVLNGRNIRMRADGTTYIE